MSCSSTCACCSGWMQSSCELHALHLRFIHTVYAASCFVKTTQVHLISPLCVHIHSIRGRQPPPPLFILRAGYTVTTWAKTTTATHTRRSVPHGARQMSTAVQYGTAQSSTASRLASNPGLLRAGSLGHQGLWNPPIGSHECGQQRPGRPGWRPQSQSVTKRPVTSGLQFKKKQHRRGKRKTAWPTGPCYVPPSTSQTSDRQMLPEGAPPILDHTACRAETD